MRFVFSDYLSVSHDFVVRTKNFQISLVNRQEFVLDFSGHCPSWISKIMKKKLLLGATSQDMYLTSFWKIELALVWFLGSFVHLFITMKGYTC